jgi:hypothetical protein
MSEQTWTWLILACDLVGLAVYGLVIERRIWWGWCLTASLTGVPFLAYSTIGPQPLTRLYRPRLRVAGRASAQRLSLEA